VIYYAFKTLDLAYRNYTTREKEMYVAIFALRKFNYYLLGINVTIYGDHFAIKYVLSKRALKPIKKSQELKT